MSMVDYAKMYADSTHMLNANRHEKTQMAVKENIAQLICNYASDQDDLLEIGGNNGWQTIAYREQLRQPCRTVIYDWQDNRAINAKPEVEFNIVDLEEDHFPDEDSSFGVVVCNQVLEHLKNIFLPLSEILRVLRPGGFCVLSVPNMCALHNCVLTMIGRQPTTMDIMGSHVRGYAIWSMSEFLQLNGHFKLIQLKGFGLHPFTSKAMPGPLRTYCHTPVWLLKKQQSSMPVWNEIRKETKTTTKFYK